jgi:hypothetical protein
MITLADVKNSPTVPEETSMPTKDFELATRELIDSYRKDGDRRVIADALRLQADLVDKDDAWPGEAAAAKDALKEAGIVRQPTEGEMKNAAAAEEAAALARQEGLEDDYTTSAAADVPETSKTYASEYGESDHSKGDDEAATTKKSASAKDAPAARETTRAK